MCARADEPRGRPSSDGLKIFFNDPVLPPNGSDGHNWRDDFQLTLHIQDDVRVLSETGNFFLTNIHRVYLGEPTDPTLEDDDLRNYFLDPFGPKPAGRSSRLWDGSRAVKGSSCRPKPPPPGTGSEIDLDAALHDAGVSQTVAVRVHVIEHQPKVGVQVPVEASGDVADDAAIHALVVESQVGVPRSELEGPPGPVLDAEVVLRRRPGEGRRERKE